jgi:TolA-binding protein
MLPLEEELIKLSKKDSYYVDFGNTGANLIISRGKLIDQLQHRIGNLNRKVRSMGATIERLKMEHRELAAQHDLLKWGWRVAQQTKPTFQEGSQDYKQLYRLEVERSITLLEELERLKDGEKREVKRREEGNNNPASIPSRLHRVKD